MDTYKVGWFSTGRDEAACDLLKVVYHQMENLEISFVFSNRSWGEKRESDEFFKLVKSLGIELILFSSRNFKSELRKRGLEEAGKGNLELLRNWRRLYDGEIMNRIDKFKVELIILAGYMLILGEELCQKYFLINLHPAPPSGPKGTWQEVIWQLIEKRAEEAGVMMHLVTPLLDAGPPLTYCLFPIRGGRFCPLWKAMEEKLKRKTLEEIKAEEGEEEPLFKEIRREGVRRELPLIVYTLKALSEGRIELVKGKAKRLTEAELFRSLN